MKFLLRILIVNTLITLSVIVCLSSSVAFAAPVAPDGSSSTVPTANQEPVSPGTNDTQNQNSASSSCQPGSGAIGFLPTWYEYLPGTTDEYGKCQIDTSSLGGATIVLILLALVNILIWLATVAAVVFVVYGGFMFVTSQGEPGKIASARKTILNAVVGLVIALLASQIVKFVAGFLAK